MKIQLRNKIHNGSCVGNEWVVVCDNGRKFLFNTREQAETFVSDHQDGLPL